MLRGPAGDRDQVGEEGGWGLPSEGVEAAAAAVAAATEAGKRRGGRGAAAAAPRRRRSPESR